MAKGFVAITVERCKGCGFCVEFCPTHVLALSSAFNSKGYHAPHVVHSEKCSGCDLCGMYCPDFAIFGALCTLTPKVSSQVFIFLTVTTPVVRELSQPVRDLPQATRSPPPPRSSNALRGEFQQ